MNAQLTGKIPTDSTAHERPQRALLRYFGGKWALAPWIMAQFPPHRIYVEPVKPLPIFAFAAE